MNPCQFPACSRQLPKRRVPLPLLLPFAYLHFSFSPKVQLLCRTLDEVSAFLHAISFTIILPLPLSLSLSVHCPLSIVCCPLSVCRAAVWQRDTFHSCSRLGFRYSSRIPNPFSCPAAGLISTNDVLQWHGRNLCSSCSRSRCCLCTDPVGFAGKKVVRMLTAVRDLPLKDPTHKYENTCSYFPWIYLRYFYLNI